ncbi:hypothetical protein CDEN61S_00899 [Castellaniella denitrificans]|uniref:DUF4810 domain-containing protein n=1 Tax=Castellaniella sp. TaxID=1955812 RepID=UPI002B003127|nr:DUF4810 domain-containing protein [Castellaniella sp.]
MRQYNQGRTSHGALPARLVGAGILVGLLTACAPRQPLLYNWESYQPQVHAYFKDEGGDTAAQVQTMEHNIETARAANQALPPGFHAHLGLLYLKTGEDARALEQIQSEKAAFPESAPFMDFLLRNTSRTPAPDKAAAPDSQPEITPPSSTTSTKHGDSGTGKS